VLGDGLVAAGFPLVFHSLAYVRRRYQISTYVTSWKLNWA